MNVFAAAKSPFLPVRPAHNLYLFLMKIESILLAVRSFMKAPDAWLPVHSQVARKKKKLDYLNFM